MLLKKVQKIAELEKITKFRLTVYSDSEYKIKEKIDRQ